MIQVCSDRALGHNFNAITCESCKAFFRRNAMSNKKFSCPFSNACEITTITRRFCQKCRLERCFKVGMKKEYIMSEEDKELKRLKIEQNRNKRKLKASPEKVSSGDDLDQLQSKKAIRVKEEWSPSSSTSALSNALETHSESSMSVDSDEILQNDRLRHITADSPVSEIVAAVTSTSDASHIIQKIMRTQNEALQVMTKIITDPSQALILISHLIKNPSDGMLIISKMMSSPLDALSVFTQFMSSPTDALFMIFKIMSSPKDVLQFMKELAKSPQEALEIMKRFMAGPQDTLVGINRLMSSPGSQSSDGHCEYRNEMIKSMLDVSSVSSPSSDSSYASPLSAFHNVLIPSSPSTFINEHDTNNNEYRQNTEKLLNEINEDINASQSILHVNSIDSIINEAIKLEYEATQVMRSPSRQLNEVEVMKIQELIDSNKALYAPVDEDLTTLVFGDCQIKTEPGVDPTLLKVINLTAIAIRRLIKMSKKISGFKRMCQEDQIALLKVSMVVSHIYLILLKRFPYIGRLHGNDDFTKRHAVRL